MTAATKSSTLPTKKDVIDLLRGEIEDLRDSRCAGHEDDSLSSVVSGLLSAELAAFAQLHPFDRRRIAVDVVDAVMTAHRGESRP